MPATAAITTHRRMTRKLPRPRRDQLRQAGAVLIALALSGCVQLADADPVGSVASIAGSWTIEGNQPSTGTCGRLGASRMRVTFLDGLRPVTHPGLFFQCDVTRPVGGDPPGFDSRDASGAVVGAGCWRIRLDALDSGGAAIASGPTVDVVVPAENVDTTGCAGTDVGDHIALPDTDFLTGRVVAYTTIDGSRANEASCAERGIEEVRLVFDDLGGGRVDANGEIGVTSVSQPCSLGLIGARILSTADYTVHLEAVDAAGAVTAGPPQTFGAQGPGELCFLGGSCRGPCGNGCADRCVEEVCAPAGEADTPTIALDAL